MTPSLSFFSAMAASLTVSVGLIALSPFILRHIRRRDLTARQASHHRPTLRLGGVGILAGLWLVTLFAAGGQGALMMLLVCSLPVFLIGLAEDLGIDQSPRRRLGVAAISGIVVIAYGGVHIARVGIAGLDAVVALAPVGIAFTVFATVGLVHAFNLVDGLNGMAGSVGIVSVLGLAGLAQMAGAGTMEQATPALLGALLGFLVLNFPKGRIFLGDAGAYTVGFILAWLGVMLMADAPRLSPWAVLLVFFWPVADTLLAIWRRIALRAPIGQPDRLHVHQVIMRAIEIVVLRRKMRRITNPLTTLVVFPFMLPPAAAGVLFWDDDRWAAVALSLFAVLFVAGYLFVIRHAKRQRIAQRRARALSALQGVVVGVDAKIGAGQ